MASRMSKLPGVEPLFAISLGNQLDLTASDYLNYFLAAGDASVYALYIEGFVPGDGLALARAAKKMVKLGKPVLVYKSGRSPEGRKATAGHTASVAGDYEVCRAVLESAGVFLADTIAEFEDALRVLPRLAGKTFAGRRAALVSNAGFECVIMADGLKGGDGLELARLSPSNKLGDRRTPQTLGHRPAPGRPQPSRPDARGRRRGLRRGGRPRPRRPGCGLRRRLSRADDVRSPDPGPGG